MSPDTPTDKPKSEIKEKVDKEMDQHFGRSGPLKADPKKPPKDEPESKGKNEPQEPPPKPAASSRPVNDMEGNTQTPPKPDSVPLPKAHAAAPGPEPTEGSPALPAAAPPEPPRLPKPQKAEETSEEAAQAAKRLAAEKAEAQLAAENERRIQERKRELDLKKSEKELENQAEEHDHQLALREKNRERESAKADLKAAKAKAKAAIKAAKAARRTKEAEAQAALPVEARKPPPWKHWLGWAGLIGVIVLMAAGVAYGLLKVGTAGVAAWTGANSDHDNHGGSQTTTSTSQAPGTQIQTSGSETGSTMTTSQTTGGSTSRSSTTSSTSTSSAPPPPPPSTPAEGEVTPIDGKSLQVTLGTGVGEPNCPNRGNGWTKPIHTGVGSSKAYSVTTDDGSTMSDKLGLLDSESCTATAASDNDRGLIDSGFRLGCLTPCPELAGTKYKVAWQ